MSARPIDVAITDAKNVAGMGVARTFRHRSDDDQVRALKLYSYDDHGFSEIGEVLVQVLVAAVEGAVWNARRAEQWRVEVEGLRAGGDEDAASEETPTTEPAPAARPHQRGCVAVFVDTSEDDPMPTPSARYCKSPQPPRDLTDRQALSPMQTADLRPILH
ncbi:hypothetical protein J7E74_06395 [Rhodococcus erythropolis]|nr:hypothetical protein [Rhodococcus erythropolis]